MTSEWTPAELPNLALTRFGAQTGETSDQFFAPLSRLIQPHKPVFIPDKYDEHGKWMDGWESKRRRNLLSDWGEIILGMPSIIEKISLDTAHFTGNYAPAISLEGTLDNTQYFSLVPPSPLGPNALHHFHVSEQNPVKTLRLHLLPDGGVARLHAFGLPIPPDFSKTSHDTIDIACLSNGGKILAYNDAHFGDPWALIAPAKGENMGDGWETRRRRSPGFDWINIQLGTPGLIHSVSIDTAHFKGNSPHSCSLKAALIPPDSPLPFVVANSIYWQEILPPTKLNPDSVHSFSLDDLSAVSKPFNAIQLCSFPDGGISRIRVHAKPQPTEVS
jgi:allantoicase